LRAPLAFLMGRVDFKRDFKEFLSRPDPSGGTLISATPRSSRAPYAKVEFLVDANRHIAALTIEGHDRSIMRFRLSNEQINPPLDGKLFTFQLPKGAQLVEADLEAEAR
jgi:outer membrane lipoprotein carrier protein